MTDENIPDIGIPDYAAVIEEQKAVIAAMNEKIKALETKQAASDAKITALSRPAPAPSHEQKIETAKSELDKAYEKILADLGIKKE